MERLKSFFRRFFGRYGDLIQQYEDSLSRMLRDILTLEQRWIPNRSDFPPISWYWYRAWPSPNYEWFPWSICSGCGMPAGNAYPGRIPYSVPFLGTGLCSNCLDQIPRTSHVFTRLFILNTPSYFFDCALIDRCIFDYTATTEGNLTSHDRKQVETSSTRFVFFWTSGQQKMTVLTSNWLIHFRLLLATVEW